MNCAFLAPRPGQVPESSASLLQTATWFFSCPSSQGDRWNLRGFLFRHLRSQSCQDVWALKMHHFKEAEVLHPRLSYIEHVFFSILMTFIFVVRAPKPSLGMSTEDGFWLCWKPCSLSVLRVRLAVHALLSSSQTSLFPSLHLFQLVVSSKGSHFTMGFCSLQVVALTQGPAHLCQWLRHIRDVTIQLFNQEPMSCLETFQHTIYLSAGAEKPRST